MRAIVITGPGGPEVLRVRELPDPVPAEDEVLIRVEAFGVNHAETHMRKGEWPEATTVSGIECAGTVAADPSGRLAEGMTVVALMGGMGRTRNGSYAEYVAAPEANVVPVRTSLGWADLAAIPESYATAWSALTGNLELMPGQSLLVRGAASALGQAAVEHRQRRGRHRARHHPPRRPGRAAALARGPTYVVIDGGPDRRLRAAPPTRSLQTPGIPSPASPARWSLVARPPCRTCAAAVRHGCDKGGTFTATFGRSPRCRRHGSLQA